MTAPLTIRKPEGTPKGGVIVIMEAFGVTDHIVDVCQRLADAGYLAVAPDLFHRKGENVIVAYDDIPTAIEVMQSVTPAGAAEDVDDAANYLVSEGLLLNQIGIVGFCMGGTVSYHSAVRLPLGAAVTFYGGGIAAPRMGYESFIDEVPKLQTPWLGLFGDLDRGIPVADLEELRIAGGKVATELEIVRFADADHGFHCPDRPAVFHQESSDAAWKLAVAWFDSHLV
ncbi:MAG: dienelactone hydrolase family protein [Actinomycetota bacterium]|nr:dienelactone hydrolase family protein [Actinomycetota bacterium]